MISGWPPAGSWRDLEIDLVPDRNIALVDLFDPRHAKKVLTAFGQAYGTLPEKTNDLSREEQSFLDLAIAELIEAGKIVSVRLALFAQMVKAKVWSPTTLREIGGTEGVGVTFLEETFGSAQANPKHRLHQKAAQAVLKALLPESGTDIKGQMRSREELLEASGYENRPRDFDDLIHILDPELRLITPTDPEGVGGDECAWRENEGVAGEGGSIPATHHPPPATRYYQLTHDYLVHSLRDWLTRKQRETRRGRAELKLAERSGLWNARPENRHLPTLWEWLRIRTLTDPRKWTPPQRADDVQGDPVAQSPIARLLWLVSSHWFRSDRSSARCCADSQGAGVDTHRRARRPAGQCGAESVASHCQRTRCESQGCRDLSVAALGRQCHDARRETSQLHARLAMVSRDRALVEPLLEELLTNKVTYVAPIRQHTATLRGRAHGKTPRRSCGTRKPRHSARFRRRWRWRTMFPSPRRHRGASRT